MPEKWPGEDALDAALRKPPLTTEQAEALVDAACLRVFGRTYRKGEVVPPTKSDPSTNGNGRGQKPPRAVDIRALLKDD